VPGAWRIEVQPAAAAADDVFLNVLEIADRADAAPPRRTAAVPGHGLTGASIEGMSVVLFADVDGGVEQAEATLPAIPTRALLLTGLVRGAPYEVQLTSGFAPGSPVWRAGGEASDEGTLRLPWDQEEEARLRLRRLH